jgi:alpha-L-fucosidase
MNPKESPACGAIVSPAVNAGSRHNPAYRWFSQARFGMFIHFCPECDLSERQGIKYSDYRRLEETMLREVNPSGFNARQWVDVAESAGCRYITWVAKHGTGFCLWDTRTTDFRITRTPFGRDLLRELSDECARRKMPLAIYMHPGEWHNRHMVRWENNWGARNWAREDDDPSWDKTFEYLAAQLTELLTNYGPIAGIWFDGSDHNEIQWRGRKLYEHIKRLQPNCLVNDRCGYGDFLTPEYHMREDVDWRNFLVEQCTPVSDNWNWNAGNWRHSAPDLVDELVRIVASGSNYLLNVGPRPDGVIDPSEAERMAAVGRWLGINGAAVYASEPVRLDGLPDTMRATRPVGSTDTVHVILRHWPRTSRVSLPGIVGVPATAQVLGGPALNASLHASGRALVLDGLPADPGDAFAKAIQLRFNGPAKVWEAPTPVRIETVTTVDANRPTVLPVSAARAEGVAVKYYQHFIRELTPPDAAFEYSQGFGLPGEIATDLHEVHARILAVRGDRHSTINWSRLGQVVVWTVVVPQTLRVRIRIRLRCSLQHAGSRYAIRCGDREMRGTVVGNPADHGTMPYPDWFKGFYKLPFVWEDAGEIDLPTGRHELIMSIEDMPHGCFFADVAALEIMSSA